MNYIGLALCCMAMAIVAVAEGIAVTKAIEGMGRNPSAASQLRTSMIVGVALIETIAIYILVIAILMIFVMA